MQEVIVFIIIAVAALYLGVRWVRKGTRGCGCGCDCGGANKSSIKDLRDKK